MIKEKKFSKADWPLVAQFINDEFERRKSKRRERKMIWDEIDRQIEMRPKPLSSDDARDKSINWFPNTELPLQATALEVLQADARRLTFPRGREWYLAHSEVSDKYIDTWQKRREVEPLIGDVPTPSKMDQETADIIVKSTLDYYHGLFGFRDAIDFLDVEAIKYGTYAGRVLQLDKPRFNNTFKGVTASKLKGPAVVPISVKNYFPDDSSQSIMMEGLALTPSDIRRFFQRADDMKIAAQSGDGWITANIKNLDIKKPELPVTMLEFEGDLVIPKSRGSIFMTNVLITVAVSDGGPAVVRFRELKNNSRSYFSGTYEKENLTTPYGTSPLMKGQPLQEMATLMANALAAAAALSAQPPALWDGSESNMLANLGPALYPGAKIKVDDVNGSINLLSEWNISDIGGALGLVLGQYEDLTGVTAPRRGASAKSHVTQLGVEQEATTGLVRTDDYVQNKERVLQSVLSMEYEIARRSLSSTPIFVGTGGIEGFINLSKADLPENVLFEVVGSSGPSSERQVEEQKLQRLMAAAQLSAQSIQQGGPVLDFGEAMKEILGDTFASSERFITSPQGIPGASPGVGGTPGPTEGVGKVG